MHDIIFYNDRFLSCETPLIGAGSRALRYGDGLFETIRVINNSIIHAELHFSRLFDGIKLLGFETPKYFTSAWLTENILAAAKKNKVEKAARIRVAVFRGNGGLYDPEHNRPNILIQSWPLPPQAGKLNQNGLVTGIYPVARKSCDAISNIKSSSHLTYVLAALYAKQQQWNDAFVLNSHDRIADSSISNVFIITQKIISTPPLSEGCVAGIMRRFLLRELPQYGFTVEEKPLHIKDLKLADECFLTNAISGIRWVKDFEEKKFTNIMIQELFEQFVVIM